MKKMLFISLCLFGGIGFANAQLKVNSSGNVTIDTQPADTSACLFVKSFRATPSGYIINPSGDQYGIRSKTTGKSRYSKAVYGNATYSTAVSPIVNNKCHNYGVYGIAGNSNMNAGVFGSLSTGNGAAVYGSLSTTASLVDGRYAGYFVGDVEVTKALTAKLTNSSDWKFLSESVAMPSVLDDIAEIDVMKRSNPTVVPHSKGEDDPDMRDLPQLSGEHFLLDVSTVEDVFPCLVSTNDQNQSYVNYTELIPVLLKAIQELKAQVDALSVRSLDGSVLMAPQQNGVSASDGTSNVSPLSHRSSKLFQNTPNPFTERTEIRFSLADDAQNAYIYVFDMQGKMLRQIPVDPSMQSVTINGYDLQAGIYLYSLAVNGQEIDTKRMILSK